MIADAGFVDIAIGSAVDAFGGAGGEPNARAFDVYGYAFIGRKPEGSAQHGARPLGRRKR